MSQALYTSKTGLDAGQTQIDVIANNVANINTTAFKSANVTFSTLFSNTLSSGSAATRTGGGTNPRQIGLGTQVASISRDFSSGSFLQTGYNSDLMISGNGYFVVQDGSGTQYLTRDGHFTLDSAGNLVTAAGYKVVGTTNEYSARSSDVTVRVPSILNVALSGTPQDELAEKTVNDLNALAQGISPGTFILNVGGTSQSCAAADFTEVNAGQEYTYNPGGGGGAVTYNRMDMAALTTEDRNNMTELFGEVSPTDIYYKGTDGTYIKLDSETFPTTGNISVRNVQAQVSYTVGEGDLNSTLEDFVNSINNSFNSQGYPDIQFSVIDGGLQLENNSGEDISVANDGQTSNFLSETGLVDAIDAATDGQTLFYSEDMNQSAVISNSYNSADAIKRIDWSVSESGVLTAKYNDGSELTVTFDDNGRALWQYTTADKVVITASGLANSDLDMSGTDFIPANMVIEMGTVINDAGLIAETDNMWSIGPNAGEFAYGMSNANGFGSIKTGGLEGSNVDMATELSNMIIAQRAIQVNSRVFSTASSILETLAYLGQ